MKLIMFVFTILFFSSAVFAQNFSLSFGRHGMDSIEFKETTLRKKKVWVGTYTSDNRVLAKRAVPTEIAKSHGSALKKLMSENSQDFQTLSTTCAGVIQYKHGKKSQAFCSETKSTLTQKYLADWIQESKEILDLKPARR